MRWRPTGRRKLRLPPEPLYRQDEARHVTSERVANAIRYQPETDIRVLTLWQPWATLFARGLFTHASRGTSTTFRGLVAIHAALTTVHLDPRSAHARANPVLWEILDREGIDPDVCELGAIIGLAHLVGVRSNAELRKTHGRLDGGHPACDRYPWFWRLVAAGRLSQAIPYTGAQGIPRIKFDARELLVERFRPFRNPLLEPAQDRTPHVTEPGARAEPIVPTTPGTPAGGAATPRESQDQ